MATQPHTSSRRNRAAALLILVAGCGTSTQQTAGPMMGGTGYRDSATTCSAPATLPGQSVVITVGDMGMTQMMGGTAPVGAHMNLLARPDSVRAGQITLVVSNRGWRTHELVVLPLDPQKQDGQRRAGADGTVSEVASLAEASRPCEAGKGEGIPSGSVGWTTVSLRAGRYELVCNLENHYADGMHQVLDVL